MKVRPTITFKLMLVFILFAAALVAGMGLFEYISGREALEQATTADLLATAIEKEATFNAWVEENKADVVSLAGNPDLIRHVENYKVDPDSAATSAAHTETLAYLSQWTGKDRNILALAILDAETGQVLASTDSGEEGKYREDQPYFINGRKSVYVQNIYYALSQGAPAMTVSAPIRAEDGRLLAVLAGHLNLEELNQIITLRTGLHESDDAFLVNASHLFVTQPRLVRDPAVLQRWVYTEAVNRCLTRASGVVTADDYRGVPSLIVHRWLAERGLCLIVKMDRDEAIAPVRAFGRAVLLLGGLVLLVASLLAIGLARTITHRALALQEGVSRFGRGELGTRLPDTSRDELGQLAREFNAMADALREKEAQLRDHAAHLEQMVEERTVALREKEHLLSEAQRVGHIGSWSYDILTDRLQYSDEMYRLFDIPPGEFQHDSAGFLSLVFSQDRAEAVKWMDSIKSGRRVKELDFRVFRSNGELRYIQCRGALLFDSSGEPARFTGTAQDVTELKLAEIQIRQQVERLTALRKIDQAITSSFNLRPTMEIILSQVLAQLQVDAADILLLDHGGQTLKYAAGKGFRTSAAETASVRIGESHAGRAAKERRLIKIQNLKDQTEDRLLATLLAGEGFVCYYGVPLIAKGKITGVLEVYHRMPLQPYAEWLDFLDALAGQAAIAIDNASLFENLRSTNFQLRDSYDATIEGWSRALDLRDRETEGHTLRVMEKTLELAGLMGLSEEELVDIRRGALLHDIGKMGVPDSILFKVEALTGEEWEIMRKHPDFAYDMLSPIRYLKSAAIDIPYCHHEKWDGTGYPRRLKGEQIPLPARIFAVVDVYDALTSDRPYRPAWTSEKALDHVQSLSGIHFDPKVVERFLELLERGQ